MSSITKTTVVIPGYGSRTVDNFALSEQEVRSTMSADIDLSQYTATTSDSGDTRTITFARRTGNKG